MGKRRAAKCDKRKRTVTCGSEYMMIQPGTGSVLILDPEDLIEKAGGMGSITGLVAEPLGEQRGVGQYIRVVDVRRRKSRRGPKQ